MSHVVKLKCVTCSRDFQPAEVEYTCPDCGPLMGTLDVIYDYEAVARELSRQSLATSSERTHWRYLPILPIERPDAIQPLAVGGTPLYAAPKIGEIHGVRSLWLKDDTGNPSASFKDRASSVAVVKALEKGAPVVTAASTGNAAASWSAFTAVAGLETVIFVPESAPRGKLAQLLLHGARVVQVEGTYDQAFDLCCQAADEWGWYNRSTAINPYLGEGKKTGALEICEQLDWQAPDYVFVSMGDGCILQATWKGFTDFHKLGLIDRLPKLIGVQAEGSAPLYRAWQDNAERCQPLTPSTIADSISVGVPRDQIKALRAVRESGGQFVTVTDGQILAAIRDLARGSGVFAEPAGATGFAGFNKMAQVGALDKEARVVVMVTGHGLKDIEGAMKGVDRHPVRVANDLADVKRKLQTKH